MERLLGLAVACCSIIVAEAATLGWGANDGARRWTPPRETFGVMPLLGTSPMPTSPPKIREAKEYKRAGEDNTCAYVNGDPDIPLYCDVSSACVYNSVRSNIGCCPDTSTTCSIWTTCLDSSDKNLYTTDNGYTLWCGSSEYPYCRTHLYEDDVFTGYTLLGCGVAAGTDSVVYSTTLSMDSLSSKSSTSSSSDSSSTSASSTNTSRTTTTGSTTTSSDSATPPGPGPTDSSAPIGAIVGGAVGGFAVIALFALGLVLLLRRRRHHHQGPGNDPYGPIIPPGSNPSQHLPSQPAMQQQFQQPHLQPAPFPAGYAVTAPVMDNRSSIAKPSPVSTAQPVYVPTAAGSPPPPSQSPGIIPPAYKATDINANHAAATQSIPPTVPDAPQQQRPESYANPGYHGPVQLAYHQHEGAHYFEMPTVKSDRELRELA